TVWTGATSSDWMTATNWSTGTLPVAGSVVTIAVTSPNPTILGGGASAATGGIRVGDGVGSFGNLTIQGGSTLTSSNGVQLRVAQGGTGVVTVTGAGSQWILSGTQLI